MGNYFIKIQKNKKEGEMWIKKRGIIFTKKPMKNGKKEPKQRPAWGLAVEAVLGGEVPEGGLREGGVGASGGRGQTAAWGRGTKSRERVRIQVQNHVRGFEFWAKLWVQIWIHIWVQIWVQILR